MWFGFRPVVPDISKDNTFIFKGEATEKYFFLLNRVVYLKPHTLVGSEMYLNRSR